MHLFTLCLHLSLHGPGLSLRGMTVKYLATCLPPFLKPAVVWPRERQHWCSLLTQILLLSYTAEVNSWFQEPASGPVPHMASLRLGALGKEPMAILESREQPNCDLPYLTADHIPISHVSGQQLLVPILLIGGNTITSMEMDTAAVSKGKITAFIPPRCMLPSCSALWFVSVFWWCCCGLSFWPLTS